MNFSNIQGINKRQFDSTMKRERITVTDYYDEKKNYDVFFRRNNRGTTPQGKLRFYYGKDTDMSIGTIFLLKDVPYLVISQDGAESNVYYTSLAVKCDTSFNVSVNNKYVTVPCAVISDKYTLTHNSTISIVSGSVTVYTGLNDYSKAMTINSGYRNFGGYYKIGNTFYNNGLAYIYMTREAMSTSNSYVLSYNGVSALDKKDATTYQLSYTALLNDEVVENPVLSYESGDEEIATVDENGLLTIVSPGTVSITAMWTDGDNTKCTVKITVADSDSDGPVSAVKGKAAISGETTIRSGTYCTYTVTFTDKNGNELDWNDVNFAWNVVSDFSVKQEIFDNKIKITVPDDEGLIGETFTVSVADQDGKFESASIIVTVVEIF